MICQKCNAQNKENAKFCENCGAALPGEVQVMQHQQQAPPAKSRKGLIAALAAVVGVLAVAVVMLALLLTGVIGDFADTGHTGTVDVTENTGHTGNAVHTGNAEQTDNASAEQVTRYAFRNATLTYNYVLNVENNLPEPVYTVRFIDVGLAEDADVPQPLTKKLETLREERQEKLRNTILDEAQMVYLSRMSSELPWYDNWTLQQTFHAERADSVCTSFCLEEYLYTGGMHPGVLFCATTLDGQTGEDIGFDEIVKDDTAFADAVENELRRDRNYARVTDYYETYSEETFADHLRAWYLTDETGGSLVWTLTEDGVHVWFPDYAFGAYAMGHGDILVPFASYPEVFHENRYTDQTVLPQGTGSPKVRGTEREENIDLENFCFLEGGFLLDTYDGLAGIYTGEDRSELEISLFGSFFLYDADGMIQTSGQVRHIIGGLDLYEATYDDDPDAKYDDNFYASLTPMEDRAFTLNGVTYYYNAERSAAQGYIFGAKEPVAPADGEMEGNWVDPETENEIYLYEWRGEFEFVNALTGDTMTGSVIYNGNPEAPVYELRTNSGYSLAEIYFYDGGTSLRMVVTFYDDDLPGGVTKEYVKAMG